MHLILRIAVQKTAILDRSYRPAISTLFLEMNNYILLYYTLLMALPTIKDPLKSDSLKFVVLNKHEYLMKYKNEDLALLTLLQCAVPGTFFWRPRLGLDLSIPTTETTMQVAAPNQKNIQEGLVVMIDGYQVGLTVVALAAGLSSAKPYPHLNPVSAYFYTNAYRWALRHLSLIPSWIGGGHGSYCDTHKVWQRRFFYMDEFVPEWLRHLFPYVDKNEWKKEEIEFKRFKKYAEPAFGKHYRYPNKYFNDFKSQETKESEEIMDHSSSSDT